MDSTNGVFNIFDYREKITALDQAIFYVYDDCGNKQAIGLISHFNFDKDGFLYFCTSRLPVTAANWHTYDAELQFYKKGVSYQLCLAGVATIEDSSTRFFCFKANNARSHGEDEKAGKYTYFLKQWSFLRSLLGQQQAASF